MPIQQFQRIILRPVLPLIKSKNSAELDQFPGLFSHMRLSFKLSNLFLNLKNVSYRVLKD